MSAAIEGRPELDRPDVVWIGYPLPGLGHLWSGQPAPSCPADRLALILGPLRAAILRRAVHAHHMGDIAALVGCSASTATYHCVQLEQAGLLVRERRGRQVRLRRSMRGDALVDVMS